MPDTLLRAERLLVGHAGRPLLPPLDLSVRPGEFWAVVGRNGSGKTTLFRTLLGLQPPVGGRAVWPQGRVRVAWVPQRLDLDPLYPLPVGQVVGMGLDHGWSFLRPAGAARVAAIRAALAEVDAESLESRLFRSLSEGQKQRVLLARVVASGARLVLLDEPTAAMDAVAQRDAMETLHRVRARHGLAVLMVSHHLPLALRQADRVLFLDPDDAAVLVGTPEDLRAHPLFHARYGHAAAEVCGAP